MFYRTLTTLFCVLSCIGVAVSAAAPTAVFACEQGTPPPPSVGSPPLASAPYSADVRLSELYPAPLDGEEEFIELYNRGSGSVDVAGWRLSDASGKQYSIAAADGLASTQIPAGGFLTIPQSVSKIFLNNTVETVVLAHPDGKPVDEADYSNAADGMSWALIGKSWQWTTTVTEHATNILTQPESEKNTVDETDTKSEDAKETQKYETSTHVLLNELFPNPAGAENTDEWIELVNEGLKSVYIGGWQLTDQTKFFTIGSVELGAGEELVFEIPETKISLNNSGDTVYLIDPFGKIMHGTTYEQAPDGEAWSRVDAEWRWTTQATPGEKNEWPVSESEGEASGAETAAPNEASEDVSAAQQQTIESTSTSGVASISAFRANTDGSSGVIEGIVTVLQGVLGTQYFYIQDDSAGIQVYSYSKSFPTLAEGDRVRVTGERSTTRGEARIKITTQTDIVVMGNEDVPEPREISVLDETTEGILVRVHGEVSESTATQAMIDDAIAVVLKASAEINDGLLEEGARVQVAGIVSQSDDAYRLLPRRSEDITRVEEQSLAFVPAAHAATIETEESIESAGSDISASDTSTEQQRTNIFLLVMLVVGALGFAAYRWHQRAIRAPRHSAQPAAGHPLGNTLGFHDPSGRMESCQHTQKNSS